MDFLKFFPYSSIREIQKQVLIELGLNWTKYDVFVIQAPTAFGKGSVAKTILNAFNSTSAITPTNLLVGQFRAEFPDTQTLSRLDSYECAEWRRPCLRTRTKLRKFCPGCQCGKDLAQAKYRNGPGIYNYHTYMAQRLYRRVLVVDECQNLLQTIRDRQSTLLWQHDYRYPSNMYSREQMQRFIEKLPPKKRKHKKVELLEDAAFSAVPKYTAHRTTEPFNGKGTMRGQPEERDCIKILPVDIRDAPPIFWPREVEKIVLLSATFNYKDIEALGLDRKKVLYIKCESPIPAENRPFVIHDIAALSRASLESGTEAIAKYILDTLAPAHQEQKGLIHATYQQATILQRYLGQNPRFMFHDRMNRAEIYGKFREASPESGTVLVASGMYEGVDLPEDFGRWQVIAKIPWPNLGNPAIKALSERDPEAYFWETWRQVIQASGRICRTPTDFGVTYCLDSTIHRLLKQAPELMPAWFQDAVSAGGYPEFSRAS